MWWRPILERLQQMSKLRLRLFLAQAEPGKQPILPIAAVNADAAAANLPAVQHHVICLGQYAAGIALQLVPVLIARAGKGMVHRLPAVFLVVVLQQWEIHHPAVGQQVRVD